MENLDTFEKDVMKKYNLETKIDTSFSNIIKNYKLGYFSEKDTSDILSNDFGALDIEAKEIIAAADLLDNEVEVPVSSTESSVSLKQNTKPDKNTFTEPHETPNQKIESTETVTRPEVLTEVQPIRTMADDIEKVHGYGSYRAAEETGAVPTEDEGEVVHQSTQDAALAKTVPLAPAPTYAPEPVPTQQPKEGAAETTPDTRWQSSVSNS